MKTVKVRIAVAVDQTGDYEATAVKTGKWDVADYILDNLEPGEARYWVTAELPIPEPVEIAGEATKEASRG